VTRGKGVSIHRESCDSLKRLAEREPERVMETTWGKSEAAYAVDMSVTATDRRGLLRDIGDALAREKINVTAVRTQTRDDLAFMRFAFDGVDDLRKVADLTDEEIAGADFGTYTRAQYFDDLFRLTQYRTDPTLVELLVTRSLDTMIWLRGQGARFVPIYGRQAGKVGGRWKFFGGLPIEASGGGAGLSGGGGPEAARSSTQRRQ